MNLKDRFAKLFLAAFDRLMNKVTGGLWEFVRGEVTWMKMEVKEK